MSINLPKLIMSFGVELTVSGKSLKGICPFHPDKNPSFFVWPESNRWKCFGCGLGGDVIDFVKAAQKISFKEAIKFLSHHIGSNNNNINNQGSAAIKFLEKEVDPEITILLKKIIEIKRLQDNLTSKMNHINDLLRTGELDLCKGYTMVHHYEYIFSEIDFKYNQVCRQLKELRLRGYYKHAK